MTTQKTAFFFIMLIATMLFVSACSQTITGASSLTPRQVLENSTNAMKQLKSAHVELQSRTNVHVATSAAGTGTTANVVANVTGTGDEAPPDQEQLQLTLNHETPVTEIVQGNRVYVRDRQGKWYVLDKSNVRGATNDPFNGITINQSNLLTLLQRSKITDHGTESLNGQNLRHITATLDAEGVRVLLHENIPLSLSQENITTILNNSAATQTTADVWIDESDFYVHRSSLQLTLSVNIHPLGGVSLPIVGTISSAIVLKTNAVTDLSNFNEPVVITPPLNATPTSDPSILFVSERQQYQP